jgi:aspartyl-tRNA(Asn)/glutamyl-tRNA(Gln) amidotransferase subunit B
MTSVRTANQKSHSRIEFAVTRVAQETRLWNAAEGKTYSMRPKEQAHDYRYFPEPDLPSLLISDEMAKTIAARMPELPEARRKRMSAEYDIMTCDSHRCRPKISISARVGASARTIERHNRRKWRWQVERLSFTAPTG